MKPGIIAVLLLALFAVGGAQNNQANRALTLRQAVDIALDRNITLKQAQNNIQRDQTGVTAAYGNFLPTVNLSSGWSGGEQTVGGVPRGSGSDRYLSSTLSASLTLFDGFSNTSNLNQAVATASSTEYTYTRTRQTIIKETRRLYYDVLRTEKLLQVAVLTLNADQQQLDKVKETARLGSASLVNVYQQQAQVGTDQVALVQAQSDYDLAKANLFAFLAMDISEELKIVDASITDTVDDAEYRKLHDGVNDFSSLAQSALNNRLDYQSAKQQLDATQSGLTMARSGYFPRISANTSYQLSGNNLLGTNEFSDLGTGKSFNWSFNLSFPLFSGFQTNNLVERAYVAEKNAQLSLEDNQRRIQVEVRQALLGLESAEKNYQATVNSLQLQDQNLKVNQEKYNVGSGTILDLLFAQNNYSNALSKKINAVYQYLNAKTALELALGTLQ